MRTAKDQDTLIEQSRRDSNKAVVYLAVTLPLHSGNVCLTTRFSGYTLLTMDIRLVSPSQNGANVIGNVPAKKVGVNFSSFVLYHESHSVLYFYGFGDVKQTKKN